MGIMVVYDVTDEKSYTNVIKWMGNIAEHANKNVDKILVANKCDLEEKRKVARDRGESLAEDLGISYVEMSALSNSNIEEAFTTLTKGILTRMLSCGEDESLDLRKTREDWTQQVLFVSRVRTLDRDLETKCESVRSNLLVECKTSTVGFNAAFSVLCNFAKSSVINMFVCFVIAVCCDCFLLLCLH